MIVVKVGGSLLDCPGLGPALNHWLNTLNESVTLVPGGGLCADAVRTYDRIHKVGDERSHWLALRAMAVTAELIRGLIGENPTITILDADEFCRNDSVLPHSWAVTSDSIAARFAEQQHASRLILLKSANLPDHMSWQEAAIRDYVDAYFPQAVARLTCPVRWINFRPSCSA